jgi:hypothetical protein
MRSCSALAMLLAALAVLPGCPGGPDASSPKQALPAYTGHATELFDDTIEPAAVGLELDQASAPNSDPVLRERVQVADAVMRARVTSATSKDEDTGTTFTLTLGALEVLNGKSPGDEVTISFLRGNPSTGLLKSRAEGLVRSRRTFVAFVRAFQRPDGDAEIHFHLAADNPETVKAVRNAAAMQELR